MKEDLRDSRVVFQGSQLIRAGGSLFLRWGKVVGCHGQSWGTDRFGQVLQRLQSDQQGHRLRGRLGDCLLFERQCDVYSLWRVGWDVTRVTTALILT